MRKTLTSSVLSLGLVAALAGTASAGGSPGSLGVGAEYTILGLGGVSVNYDAGDFHAGGFFGYYDTNGGNEKDVDLGGRFFYHLHSTAMSDFSLGGNVGLQIVDPDPGDSATIVEIDLAAQMRVFLQSNVAASLTLGAGIATADGDAFAVTGSTLGSVGLHYYFF